MTSIIRVEPFSGSMDESPLCYLLQVDEFHFLLDCGWSEAFDMNYIANLKKRVPQIDAVLLSYADVPHLGALPYLVGKCGLSCPVYATVPVFKMGQMFMYDWFQSHQNVEDFNLFTLDDVDAAFEKARFLRLAGRNALQLLRHDSYKVKGPKRGVLCRQVSRLDDSGVGKEDRFHCPSSL